jgi:hypothetical protein
MQADGPRLPIHFTWWFVPLATALGMGPRSCYVELTDDEFVVRMGWAFRGRLPRQLVSDIAPAHLPWWAGIGVHWWPRGWVVNGALHRIVQITLSGPVRVHVLGVPARLRRLYVSVDDPERLLSSVG